jgi:antitoxin component YwqK of YwqJK toxin-antitoxin module
MKKDGLYIHKKLKIIISGEVYTYLDNKHILMGDLLNGKKNGLWVTWFKDGHKLEENFDHGLINGSMSLFYRNGQKKWRHTYKNGLKDGLTTHWFSNGKKIKEGYFINGDSIGIWNYWSKFGELIEQKQFRERKKSLDIHSRSYIFKEDITD